MRVFRFVCVDKLCPYEMISGFWFRDGCLFCPQLRIELVDETKEPESGTDD